MKKRDLEKLGIVGVEAQKEAVLVASRAKQFSFKKPQLRAALEQLAESPDGYLDHPLLGNLARLVKRGEVVTEYALQELKYQTWGENIDADAHAQMRNACSLPIACSGALMPDAHVGYGLPIGGVLATDNAVIPFAVGVDIACRVKLTVLDLPGDQLDRNRERLAQAIEKNTEFGIGARFKQPKTHPVMDEDWEFSHYVSSLKEIAWRQLGTSGSGNHFVEFGVFELFTDRDGVPAGEYIALVSHSGSRGSGAKIAHHFSRVARDKHKDLPNKLKHLSWLSLDEEVGQEYWQAMELMGRYASANHFLIHRDVVKGFGGQVLFQVENHHNFAWKEEHSGREVIVHRKGATPAGEGVLGYIPGTMVAPGFLVEGRGEEAALQSCSHGAGRTMSRKAARQRITGHGLRAITREHDVTLLDAGLDEAPLAYKDIQEVMAAQSDLVNILGRFKPKIVKMAPDGELPED
ncbi:MAG: RtcB family protein [Bdellovibrionales bacterium]|nr:RtcB family protein [Bdellovibrionales bacterium]